MQAAWPDLHVALPMGKIPHKVHLVARDKFDDPQYFAFCRANPDLIVERTAQGEIVIVPPAGGESSYRSLETAAPLRLWADKDGRGKVFDSSAQFMLPDGSALSPDAAWVSNESLRRLSRSERRQFLRLCPEFVVEVISPSDRPKQAKAKMELWISDGVQLGWLIDGDAQTVHVYRKNQPVKIRRGIQSISGEGPVEGFVLPLRSIWAGLG